jgi:mono/diheme cytochrome c family protein
MFSKLVNAVEVAALALALLFVVLLFADRPAKVVPTGYATGGGVAPGRAIFATNCATCHGQRGEGGIGPKLGGGAVVAKYPNAATEIAIVANGRGVMPAWTGRLTPAEIRAVVDFTRSGL